jgi:hypothetical protein
MDDLSIACLKGSMGEFRKTPEEVLFISPEKIHGWIVSYRELIKKEALYKLRMEQEAEEKLKKQSKDEIKVWDLGWRERELFDPFQKLVITEKYEFDESNDDIYNYLLRRKILEIDFEKAKDFYAEERFKYLKPKNRSDLPKTERPLFDRYVKNDFNSATNKFHLEVLHLVRIRFVREFINDLVKQGKDIGGFFND